MTDTARSLFRSEAVVLDTVLARRRWLLRNALTRNRTGGRPDQRLPAWEVGNTAIALRWGALVLALLGVAARGVRGHFLAAGGMLVIVALLTTIRPTRAGDPRPRLVAALAGEAAACLAVVFWAGAWNSPFLLSVGATLLVAGLQGGAWAVVPVTGVVVAGSGTASLLGVHVLDDPLLVAQRALALAVVGGVGAYGRRVMVREASERDEELLRLRSADEVNSLLLDLHARASSEPGWLSLRSTLGATVQQLQRLLEPDVVVLLLRDPTAEPGEHPWQVAAAEGVTLPGFLADSDLPPVGAEAVRSMVPLVRTDLASLAGFRPSSGSGVYAPLWARQTLIGLLGVERSGFSRPFDPADADVLAEVAQHAGLAIDNARWFRRLHTLGAEEERSRIARELHDRVGQSLAAAALALDRLADESADSGAEKLGDELRSHAGELRQATRHVRETLSDLRSDTSEQVDLVAALTSFLQRVEARSGMATRLHYTDGERMSPLTEREVFRIVQEAVLNAERHSKGTDILVRWRRSRGGSVVEVTDNGYGLPVSAPLRSDAYGLLGMRERADAIGAQLSIDSTPGGGTTVRLKLPEARR